LSDLIIDSGGYVEYSDDGTFDQKPDYVIFVYGESPYAEGFGDIKSLNFSENNLMLLEKMNQLSNQDINVISLFISGRPMIVDEELRLSDAFVSIWLPGTAVEGINDVIFKNKDNTINYDFVGKLPFSWPSKESSNPLNFYDVSYEPLFEYGYGLTYSNQIYE